MNNKEQKELVEDYSISLSDLMLNDIFIFDGEIVKISSLDIDDSGNTIAIVKKPSDNSYHAIQGDNLKMLIPIVITDDFLKSVGFYFNDESYSDDEFIGVYTYDHDGHYFNIEVNYDGDGETVVGYSIDYMSHGMSFVHLLQHYLRVICASDVNDKIVGYFENIKNQ